MADLSGELQAIASAVYGNQMRQAIYDAIDKMNTQVENLATQISSYQSLMNEEYTALEERVTVLEQRLQQKIDDDENAQELLVDINSFGLSYDDSTDILYPTYKTIASVNGIEVSEFRELD